MPTLKIYHVIYNAILIEETMYFSVSHDIYRDTFRVISIIVIIWNFINRR